MGSEDAYLCYEAVCCVSLKANGKLLLTSHRMIFVEVRSLMLVLLLLLLLLLAVAAAAAAAVVFFCCLLILRVGKIVDVYVYLSLCLPISVSRV
jgi:hypothetical protein